MRSNKSQTVKGMTTRQKVTAGVIAIVFLIIIWEVIGLFGHSKANTPNIQTPAQQAMNSMPMPKPAQMPKQTPLAPQDESALAKLQQQAQANYVEALNQLQMLKLQRDIAVTDQATVAAKLATVTAQKAIVNLLAPAASPATSGANYAHNLVNQAAPNNAPVQAAPVTNYSVISVTKLNGRWAAVIGYQTNLYSVRVGDILPPDQSKVLSISTAGVLLSKDNVQRMISLVPLI